MARLVAEKLAGLPPLLRWSGIFLLLEAAWFMLLHPLVPSNLRGFATEFFAGASVIALAYGAARAIWWISKQQGYLRLWRAVAVALALGVGVGIFLVAYEFKSTLSENFHYFIFVRR
jgi:hypothetical protein